MGESFDPSRWSRFENINGLLIQIWTNFGDESINLNECTDLKGHMIHMHFIR